MANDNKLISMYARLMSREYATQQMPALISFEMHEYLIDIPG